MVRMLLIIAAITAVTPSHAATVFIYLCKVGNRSMPIRIDATRKVLTWRGETYMIKEKEDCGRFGWTAQRAGTSFDFCTATQGYADFTENGVSIQCDLQR